MKQLSITFIFGLLFNLHAQISIDSSSLPNVGYEVQIAIDSFELPISTTADLTNAQNWDFTHLWPMRTDSLKYVNPNNTPYATAIGNLSSDFALGMSGDFMNNLVSDPFLYFEKNSSGVYAVAMVASLMGFNIVLNATDKELYAPTPLSIGTNYVDTGRYEVNLNNPPYTVDGSDTTVIHYTYKSFKVDGFGSLDLSQGNFPVIRLKEEITTIDSLYIITALGPMGSEIGQTTESRYNFITNNALYKHPLATYFLDENDSVRYATWVWDGSFPNTSIEEDKMLSLQLYPNPSSKYIDIQNVENIQGQPYFIMDIETRLVSNGRLNSNSLDISQLKNGIYFLAVENKNGGWCSRRFVKN